MPSPYLNSRFVGRPAWARVRNLFKRQAAQRARRPEFDLEGLDEAEAKTDVKGTFNALAVAGLGADSLAERTAKAAEQIAKNTDKLVREAQHGGLVFA